jgi:hypothetical protein
MADRFTITSSEDMNALAASAKTANISKSTRTWVNVFKDWTRVRGKEENLEGCVGRGVWD